MSQNPDDSEAGYSTRRYIKIISQFNRSTSQSGTSEGGLFWRLTTLSPNATALLPREEAGDRASASVRGMLFVFSQDFTRHSST